MLRNTHGKQKSVLVIGAKGMRGRSHTVTDESHACFHTSPVTQLGVLVTQLSEL